jgi:hypothetical protein
MGMLLRHLQSVTQTVTSPTVIKYLSVSTYFRYSYTGGKFKHTNTGFFPP